MDQQSERPGRDTKIHHRLRILGPFERMHRRGRHRGHGARHHSRTGCSPGSPLSGCLDGAPFAARRMLLVSSPRAGRNNPLAVKNRRWTTDLRCARVECGVIVPGQPSSSRPCGHVQAGRCLLRATRRDGLPPLAMIGSPPRAAQPEHARQQRGPTLGGEIGDFGDLVALHPLPPRPCPADGA